MHRISIFSLLSIFFLMTPISATAQTVICSGLLTVHFDGREGLVPALRHLKDVTQNQCNQHWSGTLANTGVSATIRSEQDGAIANIEWLVRELRSGLEIADEALIKISPNGQVGSRINVILSGSSIPGDRTPDSYTFYHENVCTMIVTPKTQRKVGQPGVLAFTMAHELFHCVQNASLPNFDRSSNEWWVEGSANWFAHMALPLIEIHAYSIFENDFERDAGRKTLGNFSYENWPFFTWLAQHRGNAQAVMLFLLGLPEAHFHSDADIAALLSPDDWDEFAKQYSAYQINKSARVPLDPRPRARLPETDIHLPHVGDERHIPFSRRTGGLDRYQINLEEGDWELFTTLSGTMYLSKLLPSGDPGPGWQKINASTEKLEFSVPCGETKSYALVSFGGAPDTHNFTLTARKTGDPCEEASCDDLPVERDMCVIGIWEDQGPIEQYLSETPTTSEVTIAPVDTFYPDGSYTKDAQLRQANEVGPVTVTTTLDISQTLGRWGTNGNKLTVCESRQINQGTVHTVGSGADLTVPINTDSILDPERYTKYTYTCDDSTLTLKTRRILFLPVGHNLTFKRQ